MRTRAVLQIHHIAPDEPRAVIGDCLDRVVRASTATMKSRGRWAPSAHRRLYRPRPVRARHEAAAAGAPCRVRACATHPRLPSARSCRQCTTQPETGGKHVTVAHDHRSFGDQPHRRATAGQRLDGSAGEFVVPLDRLIRVGRRAERNLVPRPGGRSSSRWRTSTKLRLTRMTEANSSPEFSSNCV